jgi:hypothetical protein
MENKTTYDRTAKDLGNIVNLGHVNLNITDQRLATHYYITGLGLTRDPFLNTGVRIMWVNVGMSQFHLPTNKEPNVLRGATGLVIPDRAALLKRLQSVQTHLADTKFSFRRDDLPVGKPDRCSYARPQPLRPGRARRCIYPIRRASRHRQGHRPLLPRGHGRAGDCRK